MRKYRIVEYKVMTQGLNYCHLKRKYEVQFKWVLFWLKICEFDALDVAESWVEAVKELEASKRKVVMHD